MFGEVFQRVTFEHELLRGPLPVLGLDQITEGLRRVHFALDAKVSNQRRLVRRDDDQRERQPHTQQGLKENVCHSLGNTWNNDIIICHFVSCRMKAILKSFKLKL